MCGQPISRETDECPGCKCRTPFACAECGKELGSLTVNVPRTKKHPHGGFSLEGQPLCHLHRLTRCHVCEELFPAKAMTRRTIGTHADRHMRKGKPPRIEPVDAPFCPECNVKQVELNSPPRSGSLAWIFAVLAFGVCVLVGVLLVLMHKFGN
jgi:hypothetical protein